MSSRQRLRGMGTQLSDLPVLDLILERAGIQAAASLSGTSTTYRNLVNINHTLWRRFFDVELSLSHLDSPLGPDWVILPSYKDAFGAWWKGFKMYDWDVVARVHRCWHGIRIWLAEHFPEALPTLGPGASEAELNAAEQALQLVLPNPTRVLYRLVNGQVFPAQHVRDDDSLLGLIGGCKFYNYRRNVYLLSIKQMVDHTKEHVLEMGHWMGSVALVASSSRGGQFFLDADNGCLYAIQSDRVRLPAVPAHLVEESGDGLLLWLEEHLRRLNERIVSVRSDEDGRSISQFPEAGPLHMTAVSHGVKIRASAMFLSDYSHMEGTMGVNMNEFVYSIRMSLVPGGCDVGEQSFTSCTLRDRHWLVRADGFNQPSWDIEGRGVTGLFPTLLAGGDEFFYQSTTRIPSDSGVMEGWFRFVSGDDPRGGTPFLVDIPRFTIEVWEQLSDLPVLDLILDKTGSKATAA